MELGTPTHRNGDPLSMEPGSLTYGTNTNRMETSNPQNHESSTTESVIYTHSTGDPTHRITPGLAG